jgi:hypothetical protein
MLFLCRHAMGHSPLFQATDQNGIQITYDEL